MFEMNEEMVGVDESGNIYVYVPDWMGDEESNQVTALMEQVTQALAANHSNNSINGASLAIAMVNIATGVLADGLRKSTDPNTLAGISMVAETLARFTAAFNEFVTTKVPDDMLRLIKETEGNA